MIFQLKNTWRTIALPLIAISFILTMCAVSPDRAPKLGKKIVGQWTKLDTLKSNDTLFLDLQGDKNGFLSAEAKISWQVSADSISNGAGLDTIFIVTQTSNFLSGNDWVNRHTDTLPVFGGNDITFENTYNATRQRIRIINQASDTTVVRAAYSVVYINN